MDSEAAIQAGRAQNLRDRLEGEPPAAAAVQPVSAIRLLARALLARFRRARDETPPPAGEGA